MADIIEFPVLKAVTNWNIVSVQRIDPRIVKVVVVIDAKVWAKAKRASSLGSLYCAHIGHDIHRIYEVNTYYFTTKEDIQAKEGKKTLEFSYADAEWQDILVTELIHVDFVNKRRVA